MNEALRSWLFLLVMSAVVSLSLAAVNDRLRPLAEANAQSARNRSLLDVLGVQGREGATATELVALFKQKVVVQPGDPEVYLYKENGRCVAAAIEVSGRGLWDKVRGFVSVEADGCQIRGICFFEQNETPGLGGEIGTEAFGRRFVGKRLYTADAVLSIVKPGTRGSLGPTEVDGITGATLTCDAVSRLLAQGIERFKIRWGQMAHE